MTLPSLPSSMCWELAVDTWEENPLPCRQVGGGFTIRPRSVMIFVGR